MSDTKVSVYPGFIAGWCLPKTHNFNVAPTTTTTDPYLEQAINDWIGRTKRLEQPPLTEEPIPLESLIVEYPCPTCRNPPTLLNEAQDRNGEGRLVCWRCGWKGPA